MKSDNDIVTELRNRHANVTGIDPRITTPIVGQTIFSQAAAEIERLRAERDEARREVCESDTDTHGGALLEAERRGWDCFERKA